ncbi:uncharacterized protein LOC141588361 [Silene latifolia]|uniref:uncharacterized protein LOC141588361 n=1 Tax=Silene latifolia TaxID=37657 RepID=UPI003D76FA90
MGSYVDEILCDVIPMDACHILLGRLWQFDRDVLHRGRCNEYELRYKENELCSSLYHLKTTVFFATNTVPKAGMSLLIGERDVERAIDGGERAFLLVAKENSSSNVVLQEHGRIDKLLVELSDVLPDDLPAGLPPIRGIEHQIDLIPGSSPPNKAAYLCTLEETKELQKQKDEMFRKERFPSKRKNKLMPRAEGPYKIVGRVNNNAYKVELPGDYGVHATFNVGDLSPYLDDDGLAELRSIPFQGGGDDAS